MTDPKPKGKASIRLPKQKKTLGLSVPQPLRLPHEDLIRPDVSKPSQIEITDQMSSGHPDTQTVGTQIPAVGTQTTLEKQSFGHPDTQFQQESVGTQIPRYPNSADNLGTQIPKLKPSQPSRTERTSTHLRLPTERFQQYKRWCFENNVDFQDLVVRACDFYLGHPNTQIEKPSGHPDTQIPGHPKPDHDLDDKLIDDKLSSIRKAYQEATGNRWTDKDTKAYQEVGHLDGRIIQAGIWLTAARAKTRIGSFRYCLGAVLETASTPIVEIDGYLQTARRFVEKQRTGK